MKAWVLHGIGDIRYEEIKKPIIDEKEVLLRVRAAGICGSDIPRIYRDGAHNMPLVPGHEFSGEVVETGISADVNWIGRRVGVFPLIPCRKCLPCQKKQYEMCKGYSYLGSRRDGAFAEYVAVPEWNLIGLPDNVTFEQAAMLEPMSVAVHAMRRCMGPEILGYNESAKNTVLVYGLGTIGLMLTMFLIEAGVDNILVIGNKPSQQDSILRLGIDVDNYCNSKDTDVKEWIMRKTDGYGVDFAFECVGRKETFSDVIDLAAASGRVMLVGNPYTDMMLEKNVYWMILRNQLTVLGTWNSSFTKEENDDWHYVLNRLKAGQIQPQKFITGRMSLDELEIGLTTMRDKTREYIKEMVALNNDCINFEG